MADPRYCAPTPDALIVAPLDVLTAVYHRSSGATHLLAAPAPEILVALAEAADLATLKERLSVRFDLSGDRGALAARVDELAATGLIEVS